MHLNCMSQSKLDSSPKMGNPEYGHALSFTIIFIILTTHVQTVKTYTLANTEDTLAKLAEDMKEEATTEGIDFLTIESTIEYSDMTTQEYGDISTQEYGDTTTQEYDDTTIQECEEVTTLGYNVVTTQASNNITSNEIIETEAPNTDNAGVIAGSVVGVVLCLGLIICIVIAVVYIKRRRESRDDAECGYETVVLPESNVYTLRPGSTDKSLDHTYVNVGTDLSSTEGPHKYESIPLDDIKDDTLKTQSGVYEQIASGKLEQMIQETGILPGAEAKRKPSIANSDKQITLDEVVPVNMQQDSTVSVDDKDHGYETIPQEEGAMARPERHIYQNILSVPNKEKQEHDYVNFGKGKMYEK